MGITVTFFYSDQQIAILNPEPLEAEIMLGFDSILSSLEVKCGSIINLCPLSGFLFFAIPSSAVKKFALLIDVQLI